jgi:hypothetical protein
LILLVLYHVTVFCEDIANVQCCEMRVQIIRLDNMSMVNIVVRFGCVDRRRDERELWRLAGLLQLLRRYMEPAVETV